MAETLHPALVGKDIKPGTPEALIAVANFYAKIKYSEQPKNSNHTIFGAWYGVQTAWCAMFVSYCLNHSGNGKTINGAQSKKGYSTCSNGISWFKKKKAWYPVIKAQPGDIAFFDWDHNHNPDHTGIVVKVDTKKKRVWTIEGNTGPKDLSNGGMVAAQWRNMSAIIGVGRPAFPGNVVETVKPEVAPIVAPIPVTVAEPAQTVITKPEPVTITRIANPGYPGTYVKHGSTDILRIKYLQQQLNIKVTGIFDGATHNAVVAFQKHHNLSADGIVGPKTWAALK